MLGPDGPLINFRAWNGISPRDKDDDDYDN